MQIVMEIVMIKKKGCMPCKIYQPIVEKVAELNKINFRTVQAEDMPENLRPDIFPYFYLMKDKKLLENWAGNNERKMQSVLKRHIKNFISNE
tara:strand:+ start:4665 stop:4940 length:276 start_codon:yes stop_codon:yes gene_type:complete